MLPFRETVLLVEDDVEFARLIHKMILDQRGEQIEVIHARNVADAREIVSSNMPDIILTDIVPDNNQGVNAIEALQSMAPSIPIIVLSSWEYENMAVQALKMGAQDYLYKKDVTPDILIRSIAYALERSRTQEGLLISEERLRAQYAGIPVPTFTFRIDPEDFTLINFNLAANEIIGVADGGNIGMSALLLFKDKHEIIDLMHQCAQDQENKNRELAYKDTDTGKTTFYSVNCSFLPRDLVMVCIEDITEKKAAHELLKRAHDELQEEVAQHTSELKRQNELLQKETETRAKIERKLAVTADRLTEETHEETTGHFRLLAENTRDVIFHYRFMPSTGFEYISPSAETMTGYAVDEFYNDPNLLTKIIHPDDRKRFTQRLSDRDFSEESFIMRIRKKDKTTLWIELSVKPQMNESGSVTGIHGIIRNITDRKHNEDRWRLIVEILETLNISLEKTDAIRSILLLLKEHSGLDAVGIRLKQGSDYPLYEVIGRDNTYVKKDMSLCVKRKGKEKEKETAKSDDLACLCGKVLSDRLDKDAPYRTKGGSFWSNEMDTLFPKLKKRHPEDTYRGYCVKEGFTSLALIPIRTDNEIIGVLQLHGKTREALGRDDIRFYEGISKSIGIAFKRKMDEEKLRTLSITDRLTGLYNQHYFFERLGEEIKRAARISYPVSLIMLDLDNFKEYNDTHGHLEGNKLLRKTGKAIQSCIKHDVDSAFRYGGDEFTVILPHADGNQAKRVVNRIIKTVKNELASIQISGGAACTKTAKTITDLINAADLAMYENKATKKKKGANVKKTSSV